MIAMMCCDCSPYILNFAPDCYITIISDKTSSFRHGFPQENQMQKNYIINVKNNFKRIFTLMKIFMFSINI